MGKLNGKVAVVTGAASGIGAATARIMAAEGAKVIAGDSNLIGATAVAKEIAAAGGVATAVAFDALEPDSIKGLMEAALRTYGALDILHNNVGATDINKDLNVVDLDLDTWDWVFALCLKSVLVGSKFAIPHMLKAGGGAIVNTASMAGAAGSLTNTAYNVSKAAVMALTENIAAQYGPQNIRCNCVAPGVILTPAVARAMPKPIVDIYQRYTLTTRLGLPEDIGYLVTFLASEEAGYINGQTISADGGFRAHLPVTADMRNFKG
jgi:NAD(P)-dependent dehydrogenase (short-subunit alcohol dehydrogenase family)